MPTQDSKVNVVETGLLESWQDYTARAGGKCWHVCALSLSFSLPLPLLSLSELCGDVWLNPCALIAQCNNFRAPENNQPDWGGLGEAA